MVKTRVSDKYRDFKACLQKFQQIPVCGPTPQIWAGVSDWLNRSQQNALEVSLHDFYHKNADISSLLERTLTFRIRSYRGRNLITARDPRSPRCLGQALCSEM